MQRRLFLDRKLADNFMEFAVHTLYIILLVIICAHNAVYSSYLQNTAMKQSLTPLYKVNLIQILL